MENDNWKTPSRTSPRGGTRGCLCPNNTYSVKCCNGSIKAQGIGNIYGIKTPFLLLENGDYLLQENNDKIILNG
jgi:hypothetical protein